MTLETKCQEKTDQVLVVLALKDQKYFYCLILRYEKKLLHYILRISSSTKEDAEDILQEVFISVYKNLNDFDNTLKFSSWIYRITHNKTISHWRKANSRPKTISGDNGNGEESGLFNFIASDDDLVRDLERKCSSKQIKKAIFTLDAKYKDVLVLRFLEDKDYKDISDILKKPMGTVATLLNRAKKKFIEEVKNQNLNI